MRHLIAPIRRCLTAQQCDTQNQLDHNELRPTKISLRSLQYDRQANDIVTVLIDVIIDISLYSVIRNDEMIRHGEPWDNAFMNRLLSDYYSDYSV